MAYFPLKNCHIRVDDYGNSRRIMKEIRESGYDQELVYTYIRELLDSDKEYDV